MLRRINGSFRLIPRKLFNQSYNLFCSEQQTIKQNISRLTEYLNSFTNKFQKGNIKLDSLMKFLKIEELSSDFIDKKIFESEELKKKIRMIISYNKSLEENLSFTKFCYYDLQLEKNHYIFQTLLINNYLITNYSSFKKKNIEIIRRDQDPEDYFIMDESDKKDFKIKYSNYKNILLESYPFFTFNLVTVDPFLVQHESLISHFNLINRIMDQDQSFKNNSLIDNMNFLNVFPFLSIKVEDSLFFQFVADEFRINVKNFVQFNDFIFLFHFMENFRAHFDLKFKVEFLRFFKKKLLESFSSIIETRNDPFSQALESTIQIDWRYDDLVLLMSFYIEDVKLIKLFEFILHEKSSTKTCPLLQMVKLIDLYKNVSQQKQINNFLAKFLAHHATEHLRKYITLHDFENYLTIVFCTLCQESDSYGGSETFSDFYEEFKSCVFHSKFSDGKESTISVDTLKIIKE